MASYTSNCHHGWRMQAAMTNFSFELFYYFFQAIWIWMGKRYKIHIRVMLDGKYPSSFSYQLSYFVSLQPLVVWLLSLCHHPIPQQSQLVYNYIKCFFRRWTKTKFSKLDQMLEMAKLEKSEKSKPKIRAIVIQTM